MKFGDYLRPTPRTPPGFEALRKLLEARDQRTASRQFMPENPALVEKLLALGTAAVADAPASAGRFPLLLHSLGRNDYQQESTVLWEYLATHGFVVANVPQLGPSDSQTGLEFTETDLELQISDLEYAIEQIRRLPFADPRKLGLIGHSSGGLAAFLLASRRREVFPVASLDGSITDPDGVKLARSIGFDAETFAAPLLILHKTKPADSLDVRLVNSLNYSTRFRVAYADATHFDFQNWPLYAVATGVDDQRAKMLRDSAAGRDVFLSAVRLVGHFFAGTLGGKAEDLEFVRGKKRLGQFPGARMEFQVSERAGQ